MRHSIPVSGKSRIVESDPDTLLLWVLHDDVQLTSTKRGSDFALCGACTVHPNGVPARARVTPISSAGDAPVAGIEDFSGTAGGRRAKDAWPALDQCGYCQAGPVMVSTALRTPGPRTTNQDIDSAMSGNRRRRRAEARIRAPIDRAAALPTANLQEVKS